MSMDRDGDLFCDFCERSKDDVQLLVSSPVGHPLVAGETVHICNECVSVCAMIMVEKGIPASPFSRNDQAAPLIPK